MSRAAGTAAEWLGVILLALGAIDALAAVAARPARVAGAAILPIGAFALALHPLLPLVALLRASGDPDARRDPGAAACGPRDGCGRRRRRPPQQRRPSLRSAPAAAGLGRGDLCLLRPLRTAWPMRAALGRGRRDAKPR